MDYKTGLSASAFFGKSSDDSSRYNCGDCGQSLGDNETYEAYGRIYCGTCYQSK